MSTFEIILLNLDNPEFDPDHEFQMGFLGVSLVTFSLTTIEVQIYLACFHHANFTHQSFLFLTLARDALLEETIDLCKPKPHSTTDVSC